MPLSFFSSFFFCFVCISFLSFLFLSFDYCISNNFCGIMASRESAPKRNVQRQVSRSASRNVGSSPNKGGKKKSPNKPRPVPSSQPKSPKQSWLLSLFGCTSNAANDVASPQTPPDEVRLVFVVLLFVPIFSFSFLYYI